MRSIETLGFVFLGGTLFVGTVLALVAAFGSMSDSPGARAKEAERLVRIQAAATCMQGCHSPELCLGLFFPEVDE